MIEVLTLFVPGRPRTKGSLTPMVTPGTGRVRLTDSDDSKHWRRVVTAAVRKERERIGQYGPRPMLHRRVPVALALTFLVPGDPIDHEMGDLDKFERNVLDALSGCDDTCGRFCGKHAGLYADDAQVIKLLSEKMGPRADVGVVIQAWRADQ